MPTFKNSRFLVKNSLVALALSRSTIVDFIHIIKTFTCAMERVENIYEEHTVFVFLFSALMHSNVEAIIILQQDILYLWVKYSTDIQNSSFTLGCACCIFLANFFNDKNVKMYFKLKFFSCSWINVLSQKLW